MSGQALDELPQNIAEIVDAGRTGLQAWALELPERRRQVARTQRAPNDFQPNRMIKARWSAWCQRTPGQYADVSGDAPELSVALAHGLLGWPRRLQHHEEPGPGHEGSAVQRGGSADTWRRCRALGRAFVDRAAYSQRCTLALRKNEWMRKVAAERIQRLVVHTLPWVL